MTFVVITGFAYTTLLERKVLARLQHRLGPNRAGYIPIPTRGGKEKRLLGGFMQPAADAVKLFFKEDPTPTKVNRFIFNMAPMLAVMTAIIVLAVIPWAGEINIFGADQPVACAGPAAPATPRRACRGRRNSRAPAATLRRRSAATLRGG